MRIESSFTEGMRVLTGKKGYQLPLPSERAREGLKGEIRCFRSGQKETEGGKPEMGEKVWDPPRPRACKHGTTGRLSFHRKRKGNKCELKLGSKED